MFVSNIVAGSCILERKFFDTLESAKEYVTEKSKDRVWHLQNESNYFGCYYGNVNGHVYSTDSLVSSDTENVSLFSV